MGSVNTPPLTNDSPSQAHETIQSDPFRPQRMDALMRKTYFDGLHRPLTIAAKTFVLNARSSDEGVFVTFDTETTGLGIHDVAIQMAYIICAADGTVLHMYNHLWRTSNGRQIPKAAYDVHKISKIDLVARGVSPVNEILAFFRLANVCAAHGIRICAHNSAFDARILDQTAASFGLPERLNRDALFCTMMRSKDKAAFFSEKTGRRRAAKNSELYEYLHGVKTNVRLHDAAGDIECTSKNYVAGRKRRWW